MKLVNATVTLLYEAAQEMTKASQNQAEHDSTDPNTTLATALTEPNEYGVGTIIFMSAAAVIGTVAIACIWRSYMREMRGRHYC